MLHMCTEHYKTLLREIKDQNKLKDTNSQSNE